MFRDRHSRNKWQQLRASIETQNYYRINIGQEKMIAVDIQPYSVTYDSGFNRLIIWANMIAGVRECGLESLSYFIHTLQLSINDSLFSQQAVKTIITTNRNIVSHFNRSPLAISKLTEIQDQLYLEKHKLILLYAYTSSFSITTTQHQRQTHE